jgi:hypothetical protein
VSHEGGETVNTIREPQTSLDEIENANEVLEEFLDSMEMLKEKEMKSGGKLILLNSYIHRCPRCEEKTRIASKNPYCLECNWDSLTDPLFEGQKWVA